MKNTLILSVIAVSNLCGSFSSFGATAAISINPLDENSIYVAATPQSIQAFSLGLQFHLTNSIQITHLGIWDPNNSVTLAPPIHSLVIFNDSGSSILNGSIPAINPNLSIISQDGFVFTEVTPMTLAPGSYTLAAYFPGDSGPSRSIVADYLNFGAPALNPAIEGITALESFGVAGPTSQGSQSSYFSPNFLFNTVPEPSSFLLFGLSFAGLMTRRHRG